MCPCAHQVLAPASLPLVQLQIKVNVAIAKESVRLGGQGQVGHSTTSKRGERGHCWHTKAADWKMSGVLTGMLGPSQREPDPHWVLTLAPLSPVLLPTGMEMPLLRGGREDT